MNIGRPQALFFSISDILMYLQGPIATIAYVAVRAVADNKDSAVAVHCDFCLVDLQSFSHKLK